MAVSPRFGLDDILGNETVDFQVLDSNYDLIDAQAAHLGLANIFSNTQTVHRPAAGNPALAVRLTADGSPRLTITADGVLQWPSASLTVGAGGALTVGGTTLTVPSVQAAPGTAAAPGYAFSSDIDTGLFSPSADVLGISVGGVETNRVSSTGEIRFNRTNARILDSGGDDPAAPGERRVQINSLNVTPGRLYSGSLNISGTAQLVGAVTMSSTLAVTGTSTFTGALTANSTLNAHGGRINFEASNAVYIQWRSDLGALYLPYGNGIYTSYGRFTGNVAVDGQTNTTRLIVGGYDVGWATNLGGNAITNGRFFQRGDGGAYCYDVRDFLVSSSVVGGYVVQRDGNGYIHANYINTTADRVEARPAYVAGQNGDNFLRWYNTNYVGPPASVLVFQANINGSVPYNHGNASATTCGIAETYDSIGINVEAGYACRLSKSGWYSVAAMADTSSQQWDCEGRPVWRCETLVDGGVQGNRWDTITLLPPNGGYSKAWAWWIGYCNAGQWIGVRCYADRFGYGLPFGGRMEIVFIPVRDHPN